jgi:hypothetical protein
MTQPVLVVSTFPFHRELEKEILARARELPELAETTAQPIHTFGEAKTLDASLEKAASNGIRFAICLDAAPARMLSTRTSSTCIILGRSVESVLALYKEPEVAPLPEELVETLPSAQSVVKALLSLRPRPTTRGLVFTEGSPDNEEFTTDFALLWRKSVGQDSDFTTCSVSAAGCRNAHAMAETLRAAFADLPAGTPVVVLPGANTLKFAYVIRRHLQDHGLALVTVGDMPPAGAACHVAYDTKDLARHCLELALFLAGSNGETKSPPGLLAPQGVFDSEILSNLGFAVLERGIVP